MPTAVKPQAKQAVTTESLEDREPEDSRLKAQIPPIRHRLFEASPHGGFRHPRFLPREASSNPYLLKPRSFSQLFGVKHGL